MLNRKSLKCWNIKQNKEKSDLKVISPGILSRKMFEILRIQVSGGEADPKSSQMILHSVQTG